MGLIATVALVKADLRTTSSPYRAVLLARIAPALLFSPIAGVLGDRWDRKKVMVACDLGRAGLVLLLPFVETIGARVPLLTPVVVLFVVSGTAGDGDPAVAAGQGRERSPTWSTTPNTSPTPTPCCWWPPTPPSRSRERFSACSRAGPWRWVASPVWSSLRSTRSTWPSSWTPLTFVLSGLLTWRLRIAPRPGRKRELNFREGVKEMVDGFRFLAGHEMIRPWVIGIGGCFAGVGVFMSMAPFFLSDVLGGGSGSFGLLVATLGTGLAVGFVSAGPLGLRLPKDIIFSASLLVMSVTLTAVRSCVDAHLCLDLRLPLRPLRRARLPVRLGADAGAARAGAAGTGLGGGELGDPSGGGRCRGDSSRGGEADRLGGTRAGADLPTRASSSRGSGWRCGSAVDSSSSPGCSP